MIVQPPAKPHPVSTARHETIPLPTLSASSVTDSNRSIGRSHVLPQTTTRRPDVNDAAKPHKTIHKRSTGNPESQLGLHHTIPEFKLSSSTFPQPSTSATKTPLYEDRYTTYRTLEPSSNKSWRDFISTQQQHNEHVIETNRRLAVAMTLPQPDVPKFTGDPLLSSIYYGVQSTHRIQDPSRRMFVLSQPIPQRRT
jgi:hypothetical protein